MKPLRACVPLLIALSSVLTACGDSPPSENDDAPSTTTAPAATTAISPADFLQQVRTLCLDIGERAYRDVQKVFPTNGTPTPQRRIDEALIRAGATDELVRGLRLLTPSTAFAQRWEAVIAELVAYADHERALAAAIRSGAPEPERPGGLDAFRDLGLGGTCDDWLDMN